MASSDEMDFASLFEASTNINMQIRNGDKVSGKIISIGKENIFVDLGGRQDGIIDVKDFEDADGELTVKVGDTIEAYSVGSDSDGIRLKKHLGGSGKGARAVDTVVQDAWNNKIPIEGKITGERKGGFTVQLASSTGFCPYSQIALRGAGKESADYIGKSFTFMITEYGEEGRNVVVSRRRLLEVEAEEAREKLLANLKEGDVLTGTVSSIMPYGAFVDLGGLEGMVHVSEISWDRGISAEESLKVGDKVQVKVIGYEEPHDGRRPRIALSIKQAAGDPWSTIMDDPKFAVGAKLQGKVVRLADFGAFIQLAPAIEGLAHISQLGADHRIENPAEVLKVGQEVEVTILNVEPERRRIALCVGEPKVKNEAAAELTADQEKAVAEAAIAGQTLEGEVEKQMPFGLFVKLPNGQTGLLHISQLPLAGEERHIRERQMFRKYPLHSKIKVVVKDANGDRLSLTTPESLAGENENTNGGNNDVRDNNSASFGSLGDMFGGLKL
jgi:small subunit ribosomal protein S1